MIYSFEIFKSYINPLDPGMNRVEIESKIESSTSAPIAFRGALAPI